jgi:hypothetical protein
MRKRIYFLIIILTGVNLIFISSAFAQNEFADRSIHYFNKTEVSVGFGLGSFKTNVVNGYQQKVKNDQIPVSIQTINGFIFSGRAGLGLGVGVEFWQDGLFFPVFGHLYYDLKPSDNTFFGSVSIGSAIGDRYATSYYDAGKGGFMICLGIGYKMKLLKRLQFQYELYYKYQAVQSTYSIITRDTVPTPHNNYSTIDYKVPYNFLGVRIGILFH